MAVFFSSSQQPPLDDRLRGDAGVIGAGHPQGVVALHPLQADEDVLQRVVQRVAQVQRAGDVRRRNDDREGLAASWIGLAVKVAALDPRTGYQRCLRCGVVVLLGKFRLTGVACRWLRESSDSVQACSEYLANRCDEF